MAPGDTIQSTILTIPSGTKRLKVEAFNAEGTQIDFCMGIFNAVCIASPKYDPIDKNNEKNLISGFHCPAGDIVQADALMDAHEDSWAYCSGTNEASNELIAYINKDKIGSTTGGDASITNVTIALPTNEWEEFTDRLPDVMKVSVGTNTNGNWTWEEIYSGKPEQGNPLEFECLLTKSHEQIKIETFDASGNRKPFYLSMVRVFKERDLNKKIADQVKNDSFKVGTGSDNSGFIQIGSADFFRVHDGDPSTLYCNNDNNSFITELKKDGDMASYHKVVKITLTKPSGETHASHFPKKIRVSALKDGVDFNESPAEEFELPVINPGESYTFYKYVFGDDNNDKEPNKGVPSYLKIESLESGDPDFNGLCIADYTVNVVKEDESDLFTMNHYIITEENGNPVEGRFNLLDGDNSTVACAKGSEVIMQINDNKVDKDGNRVEVTLTRPSYGSKHYNHFPKEIEAYMSYDGKKSWESVKIYGVKNTASKYIFSIDVKKDGGWDKYRKLVVKSTYKDGFTNFCASGLGLKKYQQPEIPDKTLENNLIQFDKYSFIGEGEEYDFDRAYTLADSSADSYVCLEQDHMMVQLNSAKFKDDSNVDVIYANVIIARPSVDSEGSKLLAEHKDHFPKKFRIYTTTEWADFNQWYESFYFEIPDAYINSDMTEFKFPIVIRNMKNPGDDYKWKDRIMIKVLETADGNKGGETDPIRLCIADFRVVETGRQTLSNGDKNLMTGMLVDPEYSKGSKENTGINSGLQKFQTEEGSGYCTMGNSIVALLNPNKLSGKAVEAEITLKKQSDASIEKVNVYLYNGNYADSQNKVILAEDGSWKKLNKEDEILSWDENGEAKISINLKKTIHNHCYVKIENAEGGKLCLSSLKIEEKVYPDDEISFIDYNDFTFDGEYGEDPKEGSRKNLRDGDYSTVACYEDNSILVQMQHDERLKGVNDWEKEPVERGSVLEFHIGLPGSGKHEKHYPTEFTVYQTREWSQWHESTKFKIGDGASIVDVKDENGNVIGKDIVFRIDNRPFDGYQNRYMVVADKYADGKKDHGFCASRFYVKQMKEADIKEWNENTLVNGRLVDPGYDGYGVNAGINSLQDMDSDTKYCASGNKIIALIENSRIGSDFGCVAQISIGKTNENTPSKINIYTFRDINFSETDNMPLFTTYDKLSDMGFWNKLGESSYSLTENDGQMTLKIDLPKGRNRHQYIMLENAEGDSFCASSLKIEKIQDKPDPFASHPIWPTEKKDLTDAFTKGGEDLQKAFVEQMYDQRFNDFELLHTHGIVEKTVADPDGNRYLNFEGNAINNYKNWMDLSKWNDDGTSADPVTINYLKSKGISMPSFSYFTHDTDERIVEGVRQATNVVEHDVYAIPGDRVDLYPYSDIYLKSHNYMEDWVRWYDYRTDKAHDDLYIFTAPYQASRSEWGIFSGYHLMGWTHEHATKETSSEYPESPKYDGGTYQIPHVRDAGVGSFFTYKEKIDEYIAMDLSLNYDIWDGNRGDYGPYDREEDMKKHFDKANGKVIEPIINLRHVFHVKDGRDFAKKFSETRLNNVKYFIENRRFVSARAGDLFTIRLDFPMPKEQDTKSNSYYVTANGGYERVCSFDIKTYELHEGMICDAGNDGYMENYTYRYNTTQDSRYKDEYEIKDGFKPYEKSVYEIIEDCPLRTNEGDFSSKTEKTYVSGLEGTSDWIADKRHFYRAIAYEAPRDVAGKRYMVRLIAKDKDGNTIKVKGSDFELVVAEYVVSFLDERNASFMTGEELDEKAILNEEFTPMGAINENVKVTYKDIFEKHTEAYLTSRFGEPNAIDFDKYRVLENPAYNLGGSGDDKGTFFVSSIPMPVRELNMWEEGQKTKVPVVPEGARRVRMPMDWVNSQYGFSYHNDGDYSMYRLANHSSMTAYNIGATMFTEGNKGVYDRLYYNSGEKEMGYFLYVNAAADPGEMVNIEIDDPCINANFFVSAWVNEFSYPTKEAGISYNDYETANVIFKIKAYVPEVDGRTFTGKYVWKEINGLSTGYVPKDDTGKPTNNGKWYHAFFSFTPNLKEQGFTEDQVKGIKKWQVVLENNCVSSSGADYAIDDIRIYVAKPQAETQHMGALCSPSEFSENKPNEDNTMTDLEKNRLIQVRLPYVNTLNVIGKHEMFRFIDKERDAYVKYLKNSPDKDEKTVNELKSRGLEAISLYYTFLDKEKYDYALANGGPDLQIKDKNGNDVTLPWKNNERQYAFEAAKLVYAYPQGRAEVVNVENTYFGNLNVWTQYNFHSIYNQNDKYSTDGFARRDKLKTDYKEGETGEYVGDDQLKYIYFHEFPEDDVISVGKEYMLAIWMPLDGEDAREGFAGPTYDDYDIGGKCALTCTVRLKGSNLVELNEDVAVDDQNISLCEGEKASINIDAKCRKTENGHGSEDYARKPVDWFAGTLEELRNYNEDGISLEESLLQFREEYGDVRNLEEKVTIRVKDESQSTDTKTVYKEIEIDQFTTEYDNEKFKGLLPKNNYEQKHKNVIEKAINEGKLTLGQTYYQFRAVASDEKAEEIVVAIPWDTYKGGEAEHEYCTSPAEIRASITGNAPKLNVGFSTIKYPDDFTDIGLRIGLQHTDMLKANVGKVETTFNNTKTPIHNIQSITPERVLEVPLWGGESTSEDVDKLVNGKVDNSWTGNVDTEVYLTATNDPAIKGEYSEGNNDQLKDFLYAGYVYSLQAGVNVASSDDNNRIRNVAKLVFYDNIEDANGESTGLSFREGYYYKLLFHFTEHKAMNTSETDGSDVTQNASVVSGVCPGTVSFTMKIVPEYQKWNGNLSAGSITVGKGNTNWNNDANWQRVSSSELYLDDNRKVDLDKNITDGVSNNNTASYAPLDFTKVIIPDDAVAAKFPHLFEMMEQDVNVYGLETPYKWHYMPYDAGKNAVVIPEDEKPTDNIQYDMVVEKKKTATTDDAGSENQTRAEGEPAVIDVQPWYGQTAEQIHFLPESEILNQHYLTYEKAWVDMEVDPDRWYTVAAPLQQMVAGDMYAPTKNARQESELFQPIQFMKKYDPNNKSWLEYKTLNDRFAPAVYQRGWDKGEATVYELPSNSAAEKRNVAVAADWSHVYNEVKEQFAPGAGYSIKTDVSRANIVETNGKVLFRFPKADDSYNYWNIDHEDYDTPEFVEGGHITVKNEEENDVPRDDRRYKLAETDDRGGITVRLTNTNPGKYFLVGNPYMAHIDMKEFLIENAANSNLIEPKYWILDGKSQQVAVMTGAGLITNESGKDLEAVAPMQGFFVEAKEAATTLTLRFTRRMMKVEDGNWTHAVRSGSDLASGSWLRVSNANSAALVNIDASASADYEPEEDAAMLDDSNMRDLSRVYTIAGNMAAAVNSTPSAEGVEVGVMAPEGVETVLTFDGPECGWNTLYDAQTGESIDLYEGMQYKVTGPVRNRLYISGSGREEIPVLTGLSIESDGREVTVTPPGAADMVEVFVFDTAGMTILTMQTEGEAKFELEPGIYVIKAQADDGSTAVKKLKI